MSKIALAQFFAQPALFRTALYLPKLGPQTLPFLHHPQVAALAEKSTAVRDHLALVRVAADQGNTGAERGALRLLAGSLDKYQQASPANYSGAIRGIHAEPVVRSPDLSQSVRWFVSGEINKRPAISDPDMELTFAAETLFRLPSADQIFTLLDDRDDLVALLGGPESSEAILLMGSRTGSAEYFFQNHSVGIERLNRRAFVIERSAERGAFSVRDHLEGLGIIVIRGASSFRGNGYVLAPLDILRLGAGFAHNLITTFQQGDSSMVANEIAESQALTRQATRIAMGVVGEAVEVLREFLDPHLLAQQIDSRRIGLVRGALQILKDEGPAVEREYVDLIVKAEHKIEQLQNSRIGLPMERTKPVPVEEEASPARQPDFIFENPHLRRIPWSLMGGDSIVVGRVSDPDEARLVIPDTTETISRRHAEIFHTPQGIFAITDLASTNGTFVNNQRVGSRPGTPLEDGDQVRFGKYVEFTFRVAATPKSAPPPPRRKFLARLLDKFQW